MLCATGMTWMSFFLLFQPVQFGPEPTFDATDYGRFWESLNRLHSDNFTTRYCGEEDMARLMPKVASLLQEHLQDPDPDVRFRLRRVEEQYYRLGQSYLDCPPIACLVEPIDRDLLYYLPFLEKHREELVCYYLLRSELTWMVVPCSNDHKGLRNRDLMGRVERYATHLLAQDMLRSGCRRDKVKNLLQHLQRVEVLGMRRTMGTDREMTVKFKEWGEPILVMPKLP